MKRNGWLILVLVVLVAALYGVLATGKLAAHASDGSGGTAVATIDFQGRTLQVPAAWGVYEFGTRGGTLNLTRRADHGLNPMLTLEDERTHPEDAARFVSGWKHSVGVPGFQPQSLEEYRDYAVDNAGAKCVRMLWNGNQRPVRVICINSTGRWKLTLSGDTGDMQGFDAMAQQLGAFD